MPLGFKPHGGLGLHTWLSASAQAGRQPQPLDPNLSTAALGPAINQCIVYIAEMQLLRLWCQRMRLATSRTAVYNSNL